MIHDFFSSVSCSTLFAKISDVSISFMSRSQSLSGCLFLSLSAMLDWLITPLNEIFAVFVCTFVYSPCSFLLVHNTRPRPMYVMRFMVDIPFIRMIENVVLARNGILSRISK